MHAAKARAMKAGAGAFDIDDLVSKLITFMGGRRGGGGAGPKDRGRPSQTDADYDEDVDDEEDDEDDEPLNWERIGRKALAKSRRIPVMDFMCVIVIPFFGGFMLRRAIGLGRWRSNKKSARWASAPDSRRTRRTSESRRSSAKKTSHGQRTRRRKM
jgi:hypothetical protein